MKSLMLSLCLLALIPGPALAGRNANGAMLVHVLNQIDYTDYTDFCALYPLPATCQDLVTQIDRDPSVDTIIYLVAAFADFSSPGVNAYQVGLNGDVTNAYMDAWGICGPGALEIPDLNWPGAGTGDAVAYSTTVYSTRFKMYWFACGAPGVGSTLGTTNYYQGDHHAEWADDSTPPVVDICTSFGTAAWGVPGYDDCACCGAPTGACCFPDCTCEVLSQDACESMGGSWYGPGTTCVPSPCSCPPGACCFADGTCQVLDQAQCAGQGGAFQGIGTICSPNPCLPPAGACCFCDGQCEEMLQDQCAAAGGSFLGTDIPCSPNPCPAGSIGACCIGAECFLSTEACCQGEFKGENTDCDPNPCLPSPTKVTTWGRVKATYR